MRLFVAIDLDEDARLAIAALQQRLVKTLGADGSIKTVDPDRMHLTLAFLGEIADRDVPAILDTLSMDIVVRRFAAVFQGVGVFPPRGAPRILWLGIGDGSAEVVEVQQVVARRLEGLGIALEPRPFHPHLTLARWRTSRPADRPRVLSADSRCAVARVNVDHVTLYQSRLSPAGPAYTTLTRANLT
jgi:RNA 2',3'-cyclic 3'-phosphodiesterase